MALELNWGMASSGLLFLKFQNISQKSLAINFGQTSRLPVNVWKLEQNSENYNHVKFLHFIENTIKMSDEV